MDALLQEQQQDLNTGGKILLQLLLKIGSQMTIRKGKLNNELCILVDYSLLLTLIFQYISNWSKVF